MDKEGLIYDIKSFDISKLENVSPKYTKIWSDDANTFISDSGLHIGVLFNNKVYDNIHTDGISLEAWLSDMVISYDTGSVDLWQLYKAGILQFK